MAAEELAARSASYLGEVHVVLLGFGAFLFVLFFVFKSLEHKADDAKENVLLTEWSSEAGFQMAV